ncbi:DUF3307 domain-containing protein [Sporosarcina pasteurii]|uniref:Protein of uncharacterized function (DUF3307) n=1 Tax=Sporosarcina pasteurii TaxID=1474 RepID=A0A380BSR8_SPOPA|nr:DUF3307 domain-containing protein [Sporosarcina pasteurii]MDS9471185.1 DUF3307 domain-containing protein [Sporosarcina pasteurii]QBQ05176.1 DUF3307 domain-containing protein [Sporosarcina pasteurii]SUJ05429.1 Protein of uncharacterised function (DUF3307) [Sporosarcina pasteurii]
MTVLLLLLAHLIADFWLQTDIMVNNKIKHIKKHIFHHVLTAGVALAIIWRYQYAFSDFIGYFIFPILFICFTHLLIDLLKIKLVDSIKRPTNDNLSKLGFFLFDQLLHVLMILFACNLFFHMPVTELLESLIELFGTGRLSTINTLFFVVIIFILATSVSGHIVKFIVGSLPSELANFEGELTLKSQMIEAKDRIRPKMESSFTEEYHYYTYSTPLRSRGKLIGYLERLLVIVLTVIGAYPSIAFIIAAKSIARFKQLDDRNWAEYFLLGTLSSIFLGLVLGLIVQGILL